jgi:hypothetical protein
MTMPRALLLLAILATTACGGGQSLTAGPIITIYNLGPATSVPASPLAAGQSLAIQFHEQKCREQHFSSPSNSHDLKPLGCDAYYVPSALNPVVLPIFSTNAPCGATATQTSNGTILVTRTGPGDPSVSPPVGPPFWCSIDVTDPATGALSSLLI